MDDIYENIEEYKLFKERKISIIFDDTIAEILSNKKLNTAVTELFIGGKKLKICFVFITQSCFSVPKNIRLIYTHCLQELQQISFNHS